MDFTNADDPAYSTSLVIVEGDGEPIEGDTIVVHAVQASFDTGEVSLSTWGEAPEQLPRTALPGLDEALIGAETGTRVVTVISAQDNDGEPLVIVLDVLDAF